MANLMRASRELFRRTPDETFPSLETLVQHCQNQRETSHDHRVAPSGMWTRPVGPENLLLGAGGMFVWNSEVGRRSVGVETFWYQQICANHIVWDTAAEVVEFSRKHTANVHEALFEIQRIVQALVQKRDQRRDSFARVIERAMETTLGEDADEVRAALSGTGINGISGRTSISRHPTSLSPTPNATEAPSGSRCRSSTRHD